MASEQNVPKNILLLGPSDLLKKAIPKFKAKRIKEWKNKQFPLYEFTEKSTRIGIASYVFGSTAAASNIERLIDEGAENFLFVTYARPVAEDIGVGSIVLPSRAVRDEGTSFHYLKPGKNVIGNVEIEKRLKEEFKKQSLKSTIGLTWTTDAPFSKVRKSKDLIESRAKVVDNETASMFAVARFRNVNLGGILLVNAKSIREIIEEKISDPLKELKNLILGVGVSTLATRSFWDSLNIEKETVKIEKSAPPQADAKLIAQWDLRINKVEAAIDSISEQAKPSGEHEELLLEALLAKKELFVAQYHTTKSKYVRLKISKATFVKIASACADVLDKIFSEISEINKPGDQAIELEGSEGEVVYNSDEIAEQIYAQLEGGEEPELYKAGEAVPPLKPVHTSKAMVFLVNLPRRFRYKPYYRQFFESPKTVVKEVHHKSFIPKQDL
ncbi:MAG: hypothetical protein NUV67_04725 [archaeon]|nr:hypothetical protein [archaeon]